MAAISTSPIEMVVKGRMLPLFKQRIFKTSSKWVIFRIAAEPSPGDLGLILIIIGWFNQVFFPDGRERYGNYFL
jgi:hypothetical protein